MSGSWGKSCISVGLVSLINGKMFPSVWFLGSFGAWGLRLFVPLIDIIISTDSSSLPNYCGLRLPSNIHVPFKDTFLSQSWTSLRITSLISGESALTASSARELITVIS